MRACSLNNKSMVGFVKSWGVKKVTKVINPTLVRKKSSWLVVCFSTILCLIGIIESL